MSILNEGVTLELQDATNVEEYSFQLICDGQINGQGNCIRMSVRVVSTRWGKCYFVLIVFRTCFVAIFLQVAFYSLIVAQCGMHGTALTELKSVTSFKLVW